MQAGNLYVYAGNNAIQFSDPTGKAFMFVTAIIGLAAGAVIGGVVSYIQTGEISWEAVAIGAIAGGVIGLTAGAAAAYLTTGSISASTLTVLDAGGSWAATMAASGATTSAAIGRTFEKWFYSFYNIAESAQQVVVNGIGRIDAFANGAIYELKKLQLGQLQFESDSFNNWEFHCSGTEILANCFNQWGKSPKSGVLFQFKATTGCD